MPVTLDQVVPWGRSFDEYAGMFALAPGDLRGRVLGCADGPAAFNAGARLRAPGAHVVSCDPLYRFTPAEIEQRIGETTPTMLAQTRANASGFVWSDFRSPEELVSARTAAMADFLADLRAGADGRYVAGSLPDLPFRDTAFDLALCSHFVFLYTEQQTQDFHLAAVRELCQVAREVRVYPLLDLARRRSAHLDPVLEMLAHTGHDAALVSVGYEFQRGATEMLRIRAAPA